MGKYIIRVESMDHDEALDKRYEKGFECDGFCILADEGERDTVAIEDMSVNMISDVIVHSKQLMSAGILAKAKKEIVEIGRKSATGDLLEKMLAGLR